MYSFGRKKKSNPFIGGFVHESIQNGIYALNQEAECMLFSLDVTEKAYENINNMICDIHSNKEQYKYNFIGLFNVLLGWNVRRKKRYFCSEFVTEVLQYANTIEWDKPPALTKPSDFQNMPELSIVFEGKLRLVA
ncbi:hypothetical protein PV797_05790 [Clostridiaceae bacterium M8S5]|nr:hypothetical protein PV797_05790 [Clostridiaceae bacterium M8S5]